MSLNTLLILFGVSVLGCLVCFRNPAWVFNVGLGLSSVMLAAGLLGIMLFGKNYEVFPLTALECIMVMGYGTRLATFILMRDLRNEQFREFSSVGEAATQHLLTKVLLSLLCGAIYISYLSPIIFKIGSNKGFSVTQLVGCLMALLGIAIEATADDQKSNQKKTHPKMPARDGLYKMCRCPNYFAELVFWTGIYISAIDIYQGNQWYMATGGLAIVYIRIVFATAQLEKFQNKKYSKYSSYHTYTNKTPILIPFLPIYHLSPAMPERRLTKNEDKVIVDVEQIEIKDKSSDINDKQD